MFLRVYLDKHYAPHRDLNPQSAATLRGHLQQIATALGRYDIQFGELTPELLDTIDGLGITSDARSILLDVWRHAHDAGHAPAPPPEAADEPDKVRPKKRQSPPACPASLADVPDAMNLTELLDDHYVPLRLPGRNHNTLRLYRHSIASFSAWLGRPANVSHFTNDIVARYLSYLTHEKKLKPHTVAKERSQLLGLWNFAARQRIVDQFPEVPAPKKPKVTPLAWKREELERLLVACQTATGNIGNVLAADWWTALHLVIWDTGERIGAIVGVMRWDWIDVDGWLTVPYSARKGQTSDMTFRLGEDTQAALRKLRAANPNSKLVFCWPHARTYLWQRYKKLLHRAGLPTDSKSSFHRMRRSCATHLAKAGGNAQATLGHADPKTTAKYLDPRILGALQPCEMLFRIGTNNEAIDATKALEDQPKKWWESSPVIPDAPTMHVPTVPQFASEPRIPAKDIKHPLLRKLVAKGYSLSYVAARIRQPVTALQRWERDRSRQNEWLGQAIQEVAAVLLGKKETLELPPRPSRIPTHPLLAQLYMAGYSPSEVGRHLGLGRNTVGRWARGECAPSPESTKALEEFAASVLPVPAAEKGA